jgi:hypothetical protein
MGMANTPLALFDLVASDKRYLLWTVSAKAFSLADSKPDMPGSGQ